MKMTIKLAPCPWCKKTPTVFMPTLTETWLWEVYCGNHFCLMKPKSPHVSIRNTAKTDLSRFMAKVDELCKMWNTDNPIPVKEAVELDLTPIAKNFETKPAPDRVSFKDPFRPYWYFLSNPAEQPLENTIVEVWDEKTNNYGLGCCYKGKWTFDQHYKGHVNPTHWRPWERKS